MGWSKTSWIFLSVAYATRSEPASLASVIAMADAINHAIPTHWELQRTLGRLLHNGFISKSGRRYSLTVKGEGLFEAARAGRKTVFEILGELSRSLPDGGEIHRDGDVTEEEVGRGYRAYVGSLGKS